MNQQLKNDCLAVMRTSVNVTSWNRNREKVKEMLEHFGIKNSFWWFCINIDASGLIVKVLG